MTRPRQPLFLERQSYRRRRLVDASRMIPVFGLFLFLVPLIWPDVEDAKPNLAARGIYIFVVWIGLVLSTALISHRLKNRERLGDTPRDDLDRMSDEDANDVL